MLFQNIVKRKKKLKRRIENVNVEQHPQIEDVLPAAPTQQYRRPYRC
jgi:hypothetical protein